VPTDTSPDERRTQTRNFALRAIGWSLGLFGVIRLSGVERLAVLPFTQLQARVAERAFGLPVQPIDVTLACSGADALALCVGFILAFPVSWPRRIAAAIGGIALIVAVNIVRIGTLGRAANAPAWFDTLHLVVWPTLLMITIAAYVFMWMHLVTRSRPAVAPEPSRTPPGVTARFVWVSIGLLAIFAMAAPLYLASDTVLAVAAFIARAAAWTLRVVGIDATATGNVLMTARGGFLVTQECVSTPVIPLYIAAVATSHAGWRWRGLALAAAGPLFVALGIARLLVVALPASLVDSPLVLIHAFYQLVLAAVLVALAALWRHGRGGVTARTALVGIGIGFAVMYALSVPYAVTLAWAFAARPALPDPQGALALLPAFEAGLYAGLCSAVFGLASWRLIAAGVVALIGLQLATFATLHALPVALHVRDVRGLAVATPVFLILALVSYARPRR
jgi:exosortase/archaeosortase family protein